VPASTRLGDEPSLTERLVRIVRFRLDAGLATDAEELTDELVDSVVEAGLVSPDDADALLQHVLDGVNRPPPASANGPYAVDAGSTVGLHRTATDPDGDTLTYAWDLDCD